jgi:adenosylcobinamide-phosphate synthase
MEPVTLWWLATAAMLLDRLIGDPRGWPHPVVLMGWWIHRWDHCVNRSPHGAATVWWGVLMTLSTVLLVWGIAWAMIWVASQVSVLLAAAMQIWLISTTIAWKGLIDAGYQVYRALTRQGLTAARTAVSQIVGRDTGALPEIEVVRATVETLAENIVDAITSPVFFAVLGGAPLALAYRAVNTMDSMVGYKNDRYAHFGFASARLDDVFNFVPARLTAWLLWLSMGLAGFNSPNAWRIMRRDAIKHPSPNAGISEAMMAGALSVQLGGTNYYGGKASHRPKLGDPNRILNVEDVPATMKVVNLTAWLAVGIMAAVGGLLQCKIW